LAYTIFLESKPVQLVPYQEVL